MNRYSQFFSDVRALSINCGIPYLKVLTSFLDCRFLHGASWDNFCVLKMYEMRNEARKKVYTFRRQKRISDLLNQNANETDLQILIDKNKFNATFCRFVNRDWYDSTVPNKKQLSEFLKKNERFLLKPILSSQGKGIKLYKSSEVDIDSFYETISAQKVILEAFIEQHPEMESLNPSSVNTIRLITVRVGENVHVVHGGGYSLWWQGCYCG